MEWLYVSVGCVIVAAVISLIIFNKRKTKSFTLDTVVGERCTVVDAVDNYRGSGLVKVGNQLWAARSVNDDEVYESGEVISVVAIEGVKLICRK